MMSVAQNRLAWRLIGAVAIAFAASMALTWMLHEKMTQREMRHLFNNVFNDVAVDIRERVDARMFRQAMVVRDMVYEMREEPWWDDPDESSRRLRLLANELGVDEICISDANGMLTHSARRYEVGALDFSKDKGQAGEFASLLHDKYELSQPLMPNSLRGDMVKYVGVWIPDGGFVQVGGREKSVRNLARTAVTGLTHGWHVSGDNGGIYITTENGTIISHPEEGNEGGQWREPGEDNYCERRVIEGFPVYIVIPRRTAVVERRVLVSTSAFLNVVALVLASILVGIVIAGYVRDQIAVRRRKEMAMAAEIQESSIPRVFPPFSEELRMDIFASMRTARDVGGDFYDFYFSGPSRLTFLVADVSGKGVPAALFMMRAKATIKAAMQTGLPLSEVAGRVNDALSRDNDASMFVTAWIGDINLATGLVTYVNAGHNPPILIKDGAGATFVRELSGLMFGAMPGMKYQSRELKLSPGDMIYLYTDGMTEQPDAAGSLFGEERLMASINSLREGGVQALNRDKSPLLAALFAAVVAHGAGIEQADDCTQLIFRYNGPNDEGNAKPATGTQENGASRKFPATQEGVAAASAFLDEVMEGADTMDETVDTAKGGIPEASPRVSRPSSLLPALHIILDEIASNIVKHSGADDFELAIRQLDDPPGIKLTFSDGGRPFDPLAQSEPDTTLPVEERPIGGLGIMMVRKMASSIEYRQKAGRNVLTIVKNTAP